MFPRVKVAAKVVGDLNRKAQTCLLGWRDQLVDQAILRTQSSAWS